MPVHEHDCPVCHYLGKDTGNPGEPSCNAVDLYICTQAIERQEDFNLIRRYGSEGSNYGCVSVAIARRDGSSFPRYARALALAESAGFINCSAGSSLLSAPGEVHSRKPRELS
jgi:hypothetical protein